MTEDAQNTSDLSSSAELERDQESGTNEDAETSAARRELKQTTISDETTMPSTTRSAAKLASAASPPDAAATKDATAVKDDMAVTSDGAAATAARTKTPDLKAADLPPSESLQEQISSPKKKRAHDEVDEQRELASESGATQEIAATTDGRAPQSRSDRDEPEKKRPRDQKPANTTGESRDTGTREPTSIGETDQTASSKSPGHQKGRKKLDATSSSAFAKSGFAKLAASSSSPFGALGGSSKPNLFGGGGGSGAKPPASLSPFGALAAGGSKPTLGPSPTASQDSRSATASGSNSPFASLNGPTKGFGSGGIFGGSTFGGGGSSAFGPSLGGTRLMTFGKPGEALKSDKPAKPFGAPESDAEEDDAEDAAAGDEDEDGSESEERDREDKEKKQKEQQERERDVDKEDAKSSSDDRKKPRLQRITVDDGETGEVTILQVRTKMFQLEDKETGWKERGSGMLKINVPESCVSFDDSGLPIAGSFDASGLDADSDEEDGGGGGARGKKIVRLIMRQDHTLRVILNTAIVGATKFQTREALKATNIIFTAFEGDEGRPVQMKMNPANAQTFLNEVELIQRELQNA